MSVPLCTPENVAKLTADGRETGTDCALERTRCSFIIEGNTAGDPDLIRRNSMQVIPRYEGNRLVGNDRGRH